MLDASVLRNIRRPRLRRELEGRRFLNPVRDGNTILVANVLAAMGFPIPVAVATKLVLPERSVVAVSGDGGFLMNSHEPLAAMRLHTAFECI